MKYGRVFLIIAGLLLPSILGASGISQAIYEGIDSPLGGLSYVAPPQEVWLNQYIAQADYGYPLPQSGPFNVIPLTDIRDSTAYLMIGLKGKKEHFAALPPMNLSFVIDTSVYMENDKLEWVKEAFRAYIDLVRERDIISVVTFGSQIELLVPPTLIQNQADRDQFMALIEGLEPEGAADVYQGMLVGYAEVEANYQGDYLNRVILLTGGRDNSGCPKPEFLKANSFYNNQGIDISTIALGMDSDSNLMADIAAAGGGAFRFIRDFETMEQAFSGDLDRLVVPAVWQLSLELSLSPGVRLREVWGYRYAVMDGLLRFPLGTLHNGDTKTLVVTANLENTTPLNALGAFSVIYTDIQGRTWRTGPFPLTVSHAAVQNQRALTDLRIREVDGIITLGKSLMNVGNRVVSVSQALAGSSRRNVLYQEGSNSSGSTEQTRIAVELENCLEIVRTTRDYLADINNNSDITYSEELQLLENYEYVLNQIYGDYLAYY
ncbi:VWA domain-containing protein [Treponema sp. TIM-1]|uniref:vWA domain-containing protein n=1 Tax=Treponema sp. TIM-1 TaxID=2898417 RepID=UPI00397F63E2